MVTVVADRMTPPAGAIADRYSTLAAILIVYIVMVATFKSLRQPLLLLISVPFGALPQVGKDNAAQLKGKIVLDTCNPYLGRDGDMAKEALEKGTGVVVPTYLPGVRLVRAFNQVSAAALASEAHRSGEKIGVPLASDDKQALDIAQQLVRDAGFDPVVVGGLSTAKSFDQGAPAYHTLTARELRKILGIKS